MYLKLYLLLGMIFLHIIDDFTLQGILAQMKQKKWWETAVDSSELDMYKYDYIAALIIHSFSWTFMIMLIPFLYGIITGQLHLFYFFVFFMNLFIHAHIDDLKANRKIINLCTDQFVHVVQIIVTWYLIV